MSFHAARRALGRATIGAVLSAALLVPLGAVPASAAPLPPAAAAASPVMASLLDHKTSGTLKTLVIPVHWAKAKKDGTSKADLARMVKGSDRYFKTISHGKLRLKAKVLPSQKIKGFEKKCSAFSGHGSVEKQATKAARKLGVNPASYDRVVIYVPKTECPGQWTAGLGDSPGRIVWMLGNSDPEVLTHELGHNLGFGHANSAMCRKGSKKVTLSSKCSYFEYDDYSDIMGHGRGWVSGAFLHTMSWLPRGQHAVATKTRTINLKPVSSTSRTGKKFIEVPVTATRSYWVEYRTATGLDKYLKAGDRGVQVRMVDSAISGLTEGSYLLDMAPKGAATTLARGKSWTSPEGVRIKVVKAGKKGATIKVDRKRSKMRAPAMPEAFTAREGNGVAELAWRSPGGKYRSASKYVVQLRCFGGKTETIEVDPTRWDEDGIYDRDIKREVWPTCGELTHARVQVSNRLGSSPWTSWVDVQHEGS